MLRAGVGLSTDRDAGRAGADAANTALRCAGLDSASVALVFATTAHGPGYTRVTRAVSETCATANVVGCSAAGVLAAEDEVEGGHGVAVLVLGGEVVARRFFVPFSRSDPAGGAGAIAAAVRAEAAPGSVLVLFTDAYNVDAETVLEELGALLPGVRVIGGCGSEDGSVGEIAVFSGDTSSSRAASGVLLGEPVRATVEVCHAVRPVSPVHRVTRAEGNVVHELDGAPAHEALFSILPAPLRDDPRRALASVLVGFASGSGGFVARHIVALDPARGRFAVAAHVTTGQELFFGVRDPYHAREEMQRVLTRRDCAVAAREGAGALYVNCVGRGRAFHGVPGLDTAYLRQHLGALPVAGFFSGGEFAPGGGGFRLHQYTGVLTVLGGGA